MKHVVIPVDSSAHAAAAARMGVALARHHGAKATLFRALDFTTYTVVAPDVWRSYNEERLRSCRAELERLKAELASSVDPDITIEAVVEEGHAAEAIVAYAADTGADLIAMGTYGANKGEQFLLGSVAARVARTASCPVLVTRADRTGAPPDGAFRYPVVAVDYSKFSVPAARLAAGLATDDATIELIHIVHWPDGANADDMSAALSAARAAELQRLEAFAANVDLAEVGVSVRADLGRAADHILDYVASSKTDVVIVGAHGRDERISHLGTVADRILRGSSVPVILLPERSLAA
jgi:nucleotide-binding universal stress UspA family protein